MKISRLKLAALLFATVLSVAMIPKARRLGSPDFKVFYTAAQWSLQNPLEMYQKSPDRYLYPPSTAILLRPFAFTSHYEVHQWIWHALLGGIIFYFGAISWSGLLALLLLLRYLMISLSYGQINLVVMLLLWGAGHNLTRRVNVSASLWGLATSIKVYPGIFFPAYFYQKNYRGFFIAFLAGLFLLALPFFLWGSEVSWQLYRDFFASLESKGIPLHSHNQSFTALFMRLFTDQIFYLHAIDYTKWTLLALPIPFVRLFSLLFGVALSFYSWRLALRRGPADFLSAMAFSMLFLSHIVWKDYLLFLYFPLSLVLPRMQGKIRWIFGAAFALLATISSMDVVGAPLAMRMDAACIHLWGAILVWIAWCKYGATNDKTSA